MFSHINHPKNANINQFDSISQPSDWKKKENFGNIRYWYRCGAMVSLKYTLSKSKVVHFL